MGSLFASFFYIHNDEHSTILSSYLVIMNLKNNPLLPDAVSRPGRKWNIRIRVATLWISLLGLRWSSYYGQDDQILIFEMLKLLLSEWSNEPDDQLAKEHRCYLDTVQVEPVWVKAVRVGKGFWIPVRYFKHKMSLLFDKKADNENISAHKHSQEIGRGPFETCVGYTSSRWRWFALAELFPQSGTYFNYGPELGFVLIRTPNDNWHLNLLFPKVVLLEISYKLTTALMPRTPSNWVKDTVVWSVWTVCEFWESRQIQ